MHRSAAVWCGSDVALSRFAFLPKPLLIFSPFCILWHSLCKCAHYLRFSWFYWFLCKSIIFPPFCSLKATMWISPKNYLGAKCWVWPSCIQIKVLEVELWKSCIVHACKVSARNCGIASFFHDQKGSML